MPTDLSTYLDPTQCAVLVFECQENVLGASSLLPGLAAAAKEADLLAHIRVVLDAGRSAGVPVFYCTAETHADGLAAPPTPLMDRLAQQPTGSQGDSIDTSVISSIAPEKGEVVIARQHGLSAFHESGLDPCLRDLGTRTLILMGVSLNIGIFGSALEAVNRGLRVIVPRDCTVSDPPEYAEALLRYSVRHLAYLSDSEEIARLWQASVD
ncbi:MAG: cysteine hydrolase [Myxococcota bacterium]|nr:cysteine hydrolase [Myxococcota bacterium]